MNRRVLRNWMMAAAMAAAFGTSVQVNAQDVTVKVDGTEVQADVKMADQNCFMTLEDLATALAGTDCAFDVIVDANSKKILTHRGGTFEAGVTVESEVPEKEPEGWSLVIDGAPTQPVGWQEEGDTQYVNVKDISYMYGFRTAYDEAESTLNITTGVGYPLELDTEDYTTGSITVFGEEVPYKAYTAVYVSNPASVSYEVMKIYVPENATQESPVMFPLRTGAHMHVDTNVPLDVDETNINESSTGTNGSGGMHAASYLMSKGWVVATAAARGLDTMKETADGEVTLAGVAPYCATDLKAAIRFLKYNDEVLPGDCNKIVVTGTSGGGTMTSILGATGNSPMYDPYLEEIGAADTSDNVFAVLPYCPVADLDNQAIGVEWVFQGSNIPNRLEGTETGVLSREVARTFVKYINGLGYKAEDGTLLNLDEETPDGTFKNYYCDQIADGFTAFMKAQNYVAEDGSLNEEGQKYFDAKMIKVDTENEELEFAPGEVFTWAAEDGGKASLDPANYQNFLSLYTSNLFIISNVPSRDNGLLYGDVTEPQFDRVANLFNPDVTNLKGWVHFEVNLGESVKRANEALGEEYFKNAKEDFIVADEVQKRVAMYNPVYYIKDMSGMPEQGYLVNEYADDVLGTSDVAPYWHIRVGTWDHVVSLATETAFSLALKECPTVKECDFQIVWNQMHCGWYDNTEAIEWLEKVCAE